MEPTTTFTRSICKTTRQNAFESFVCQNDDQANKWGQMYSDSSTTTALHISVINKPSNEFNDTLLIKILVRKTIADSFHGVAIEMENKSRWMASMAG